MAERRGAMEGLALKRLFGGVYAGTNVLVTGHTGFKGSWLCLWLRAMGANVTGLALPPDSDASHWNLLALRDVRDVRTDLRNFPGVRDVLSKAAPKIVFHLAAQPLVRRSYRDPVETFSTNVMGLVNLFEAIRDCPSVAAVVNATTDKVYLDKSDGLAYSETHPLGGHDPYSTSKACAELVSECYRKSFFSGTGAPTPRIATARAGNVIGGGDWSEDRLVPDLVRSVIANEAISVRNPDAIRPWQHVLEPLSGYLRLGQALISGEPAEGSWNFGPGVDSTLSVRQLLDLARTHWPDVRIQSSTGPHPHEASAIRLDCSKAALQLGWRPVWNAGTTITRTVDWYRSYLDGRTVRSADDLHDYVTAAAAMGETWTQ